MYAINLTQASGDTSQVLQKILHSQEILQLDVSHVAVAVSELRKETDEHRSRELDACFESTHSDSLSHRHEKPIVKAYIVEDLFCMACGSHTEVSIAHILKTKQDCARNNVKWAEREDISNFLTLCGSKGKEDTCHDLFDNFKLGFCYHEDEHNWKIVSENRLNGRPADLRSNPHRAILHTHLAKVIKKLAVESSRERVNQWKVDFEQIVATPED